MPFRSLLPVLVLLASGCGGSTETVVPDPYALSERSLAATFERLTAPAVDSAAVAGRTRFAARRMAEYGLMPAFASGFLAPTKAEGGTLEIVHGHLLGYVAGRDPSYADTLVLVAADLDTAGAAASLETARRLALEAIDAQMPARTVLFALWVPPRTDSVGLGDFLDRPTWGRDGISHVLVVGDDASTARRNVEWVERHGRSASFMEIPELLTQPRGRRQAEAARQSLLGLADTLYERVRALASTSPDHPDGEAR